MFYTKKEGMNGETGYETEIIMTAITMVTSFVCHEENGKDLSIVFTSS